MSWLKSRHDTIEKKQQSAQCPKGDASRVTQPDPDKVSAPYLHQPRYDEQGDRFDNWHGRVYPPTFTLASTRQLKAIARRATSSRQGGGVTPAEQELYDDEFKLREHGYSQAVIDSAQALLRDADRYVRSGTDADWNGLQTHLASLRSRPWFSMLDRFPLILPRQAGAWAGLRPDLDYDPAPALRCLKAPVLVMLGERDPLTPTPETARRITEAFRVARNADATVKVVAGADHGFWVPRGESAGWLDQYPAPGWIDFMSQWIVRHAAPRRATTTASTP